ncbi:F-box/kelch-repeat protein At1g57790-like [Papaver somniferum]|uniref:F-box/kelch-repeat protein At1g57790-like n=1 Tax=Papaver somniferum TaxID=3469 RepID=UPI000E6F5FED|nr:F-box/kelch-repeat protein At1g57790-like [Papaver somniferum]
MDRDNYYSVVSFSSLPTSSDCVVFAMDESKDGIYIDFIRRREAHWRSHNFDTTTIGSYGPFLDTAIFLDGAFFCVDHHGNVGVFSTKDTSWKVEPHEIKEPHEIYVNDSSPGFLVECGGDLLLVKLEYDEKPIRILNLVSLLWNG